MPPTNPAPDLTRAEVEALLAAMPLAERERLEMAVVHGIIDTLKELRKERLAELAGRIETAPEGTARSAA